jgi:hypothetical protein
MAHATARRLNVGLLRQRGVWPFLLYGGLSAFCYVLSFKSIEDRVVNILAPFLWLFGPTATLVYGAQLVHIYRIETAVIFALVLPAVMLTRRSAAASAMLAVLAALVWLFFGVLVYTPAM